MVKLDQVSVGDTVRTLYDDGESPWCISHTNQQARVLDVRPSRGERPVLVEYLYRPFEGDLHWLHLDQFEILNKAEGYNMGNVADIKVGDKVRVVEAGVNMPDLKDNLGKLAEVIEVYKWDTQIPILVQFLSGKYAGNIRWLHRNYFQLEEVEEVEVDKIKAGDFVVIDTTHSGDILLEGLHGKVVKVVEVDPTDTVLPIAVVLPNGDNRWMYPKEFYAAPIEDFNILVDNGKGLWYGEASGNEVPVVEADYSCPFGFFFKVNSGGGSVWVNRMDCAVIRPEEEESALLNEGVELAFTVMKSYTNGEVNTFLRIDKQSTHFYEKALLAEFNESARHGLICRSVNKPDFVESCNTLYLRGKYNGLDDTQMLIPGSCLEQVVTTLVDLKAWMLNRCKQ